MVSDTRWLLIRQLDQRFEELRAHRNSLQAPPGGWIRAIRRALGMTASQLAERMRLTPGRITQLEQQEAAGKATLSSLKKAADALDCDLIVTLIPRQSLDNRLRTKADERSADAVLEIAHSMSLEKQRPSDKALEEQRKALADEFLRGPLSRLWKKS
ncbi:MAG: mobile mystery protein A [Gammaproteobacteria bacterium]|nr:mobile mystery protein A [Gammaproteobacteria bacterium]